MPPVQFVSDKETVVTFPGLFLMGMIQITDQTNPQDLNYNPYQQLCNYNDTRRAANVLGHMVSQRIIPTDESTQRDLSSARRGFKHVESDTDQ